MFTAGGNELVIRNRDTDFSESPAKALVEASQQSHQDEEIDFSLYFRTISFTQVIKAVVLMLSI